MSTTEAWTILRLLNWTTDFLKKSGSTSPRLDAEVLLAHACECQRIDLYTTFDKEPTEVSRTAFRELVRRRAEGTPVAYLVGHKEFYALSFEVNPDVLIPRPETEHLVVEALDRAKTIERRPLRIADVGTGSGVIAIAVAKHLKNCHITAIDFSEAALKLAERNAQKHQLAEHITFIKSNLLADCPDSQFDMILSNPPYVSESEYELLPNSVKQYEPRLALVGGTTGSEIITDLLVQSHSRLADGGYCIFEFSPMLAKRIKDYVGPGWLEPHITKDYSGLARIVTLRKA